VRVGVNDEHWCCLSKVVLVVVLGLRPRPGSLLDEDVVAWLSSPK